ncbi:bifunctional DNA primase/polymerase [Fulvimarina manganoxydans]|nr:bifunctional DNA primase/polymerase [Fulvimarina manganoxydans]
MIAERGWAVIPQEQNGRMPAKVDGERLKWSTYQDVGPDLETVERWSRQAIGMNAAIILGKASANCFAIDVDVTDEMLSWAIQSAADECLGRTPLVRVGNYPKAAIFFRVEHPEDLPANRSVRLLEEDGETVSPHLVEILGQGKLLTVNGRHHKTGDRFSWMRGASPSTHGPEAAPLVTPAQIERFLSEVEKIRGFERKGGAASGGLVEMSWSSSNGVEVPNFSTPRDADWTERDGLVRDGRDAFLLHLTGLICRANPAACQTGEGRERLMTASREEFGRRAEVSGRWSGSRLATSIKDKIERTAGKVSRGEMTAIVPHRERKSFSTAKEMKGVSFSTLSDDTLPVVLPDAGEESIRISAQMKEFFANFFGATAQHHLDLATLPEGAEAPIAPLAILKSPVGTGKTTSLLDSISSEEFVRLFADMPEEFRKTTLLLVPTHDLAVEVVVKAQAAGLKTKHLFGLQDERSGCFMHAKQKALSAMGLSGAGLCRATVHKSGTLKPGERTTEDVFCRHNPEDDNSNPDDWCQAKLDRQNLLEYDLVVSVHSYVAVNAPKLMKEVAAVVIDESVWDKLCHVITFSRSVLRGPRKPPYMTKTEKLAVFGRDNPSADEVDGWVRERFDDRDRLVAFVEECWKRGRDPAKGIALGADRIPDAEEDHEREKREKSAKVRQDCLASALLVASRAASRNATITPATSNAEIERLAGETPGRNVGEEAKLWRLLTERVERYLAAVSVPNDGSVPMPSGLDRRIAPLAGDRVRLSWLSQYPFGHLPTLLLDASADEKVVTAVFGREPHVEEITADQRMWTKVLTGSTFTKSQILDRESDAAPKRREKRATRKMLRQLIAQTAAEHGAGRILVTCPKAVEAMLERHWRRPANVDILHFGALRGKDWAKQHRACIVLGAMYPDRITVDGMTAALTPEDEDLETPLDPRGDGDSPDGAVVYRARTLRMRDGRTMDIETQEYSGEYSSRLLRMIRDEEIVQALGRLRATYRSDMPHLYIVGSCVPEGTIVDEVEPLVDHIRDRGRLLSHADGIADESRATNTGVWKRFLRAVDGDEALAAAFHHLETGTGTRILVAGWVADDDVRSIAADRGARILRTAARSPTGKPPVAVPKPANALLEAVLAQRAADCAAQGSPTAPVPEPERKTAAMAAADEWEDDFKVPELPPDIPF